jgi:hypothetical protein
MEELFFFLELVETSIEGFFLIKEELIEFNQRDSVLNSRVLRYLLDLLEEFSQSEPGSTNEVLCIIDTPLETRNTIGHVILVNGLRNVEVLAHKGIAYLYQFIPNVRTLLENYHVNCSGSLIEETSIVMQTCGVECSKVGKSLASGGSVHHFLKSHCISGIYRACQITDRNHSC